MIQIRCDDCEKVFEAPDEQAGQKIVCPYCGDVNRVPDRAANPAATSAPSASPAVGKAVESGPEQVIAVVRQAMFRAHPFWYSLMVFILLGGGFLAFKGWQATSGNPPATQPSTGVPSWLMYVGLAAMAIALIWWLAWWAAPHRWIKLTITNKRTIRQEGIVVRRTSEVLHRHVTNVMIRQGFMDRIFNVGYIGIDSAGQGGEPVVGDAAGRSNIEIEVQHIPKPYSVKQIIDRYRMGGG